MNEQAITLSNCLDNKVEKVIEVEKNYNLVKIFENKLPQDEKDKIYEMLINDYLKKIKELKLKTINSSVDIDDITRFFDYDYFFKTENSEKKYPYSDLEDEADCIADDLVLKVLNNNNRKIDLPIKIDIIKEYCFSSKIKSEDIEKAILWIILRLSVIYNMNK